MMKEWEELTEEDRKALRGSKFAPLPAPPSTSSRPPRFAHPGGPLATNKAAALAKFLERKLQEPDGLASINPALIEQAVKNAKETVKASGSSNSGKLIRHVTSFADAQEPGEEDEGESQVKVKDQKSKKHNKKKNKKKKKMEDLETTRECRKPKKKLKL